MSRWLLVLCCVTPLLALAGVDPTLPPALPANPVAQVDKTAPAPRLQAILRGPTGARAVIDGRSLHAGEHLGDLRVLAIRARSVVIEHQGQRSELYLSQPILTPSTRSLRR